MVTAKRELIKFSWHSEAKVVRAMPYVSLSRNLSINKVLGRRSNSVTINWEPEQSVITAFARLWPKNGMQIIKIMKSVHERLEQWLTL